MTQDPATGVWSAARPGLVEPPVLPLRGQGLRPVDGEDRDNRVTDPYSVALAAKSARSQIADLADADLKPFLWSLTPKPFLRALSIRVTEVDLLAGSDPL
jgi:hypothetical protein